MCLYLVGMTEPLKTKMFIYVHVYTLTLNRIFWWTYNYYFLFTSPCHLCIHAVSGVRNCHSMVSLHAVYPCCLSMLSLHAIPPCSLLAVSPCCLSIPSFHPVSPCCLVRHFSVQRNGKKKKEQKRNIVTTI